MTDLGTLVAQVGLPCALVVFFVWIGWLREKGMTDRLTKLETDDREEMKAMALSMRDTVAANTAAILQLAKRPCLWTEEQREAFVKTMKEPE